MTEWTPELMTAMVDEAMTEAQNLHPPLRRSDCERIIRAALAAMQPRWRDVRTDPPPRDETVVLATDGTEQCMWNALDSERLNELRVWVHNRPFHPTHWQPLPPLPTAPEDRT